MSGVDIHGQVAIAPRAIFALFAAWREPEVADGRLKDTSASAENVDLAKLLDGEGEHVLQGCPRGHVGLLENRTW